MSLLSAELYWIYEGCYLWMYSFKKFYLQNYKKKHKKIFADILHFIKQVKIT